MSDFMVSDDIKDQIDVEGAFQDVAKNVVTVALHIALPGEHDVNRVLVCGGLRGFRLGKTEVEVEMMSDLTETMKLINWSSKMCVGIEKITLSQDDIDTDFDTSHLNAVEFMIADVDPQRGLAVLGLKLQG